MNNTKPKPKHRRWLKYGRRLLIGLVGLALAWGLLIQIENWRGQREWQRVQSEVSARGINLNWDDFIPAQIPDNENLALAPVIAHWSQDADPSPAPWQDRWGDRDELLSFIAGLDTDGLIRSHPRAAELLESQIEPFADLLEAIRFACDTRPRSRLPGDYTGDPFGAPMPPFSVVRNYSKLLFAESMLALHQGDSALALTNAATIQRLGQLSEEPYYLVNAMIQVVLYKNYILPIYNEGMRIGLFSDAQLEAIASTCQEADLLGDLERAFRTELAAGAESASHVIGEKAFAEAFSWGESQWSGSVGLLMPEGWHLIMLSRLIHYNSMLLAPFEVPDRRFDTARFQANNELFEQVVTERKFFNSLAAMALPAFRKIQEVTITQHLLTDMCGISAGLELYRRKHKAFPVTLDPDYLPALHHDPLTAAPYHYERTTPDTYRLWSVGLDQENNNGNNEGDDPQDVVAALSAQPPEPVPEQWMRANKPVSEIPRTSEPAIRYAETISVDFPDEEVRLILRNVAELFDLNLIIPNTLTSDERVSINLRDVTWPDLFDILLEPVGYTWYREQNVIKIISVTEMTDAAGFTPKPKEEENEEIVLELPNQVFTDDTTFSLNYADNSIYEIIQNVAAMQKLDVKIPEALKDYGTSISLRNITWRQAFEVLLGPIDYSYYENNSVIHILPEQE